MHTNLFNACRKVMQSNVFNLQERPNITILAVLLINRILPPTWSGLGAPYLAHKPVADDFQL
jgi:hypothetical protein